MKLPSGCSIEWCKEPAKQDRLLTWLEANPYQRQCLFEELNDPGFTKATCAINAARYVFAHDENPRNSAAIKLDPRPFAEAVRGVIARRWRPKYQEVNKVLGPVGARLPIEQFQRGSNIYKKCEEQMEKFPQWRRLHVFWRTLPYYNQFASKSVDDNGKLKSPNDNGKPKSSNFGTPMKRKRGTKEIESDSSDDAVEVNMSTTAPKKKRTQRTVAEESAPRKAKAHTPETDEDEIDEVMQAHRASSTKLSADQLFQIKMAELRYKTQKEENIARQQEQTQKVLMALLDSMKR